MTRAIQCRAERWPLSRPFRISRGTKVAAEVVVVEIREGSRLGRGEGVPYPRYGESPESALAQIEQIRSALEGGMSRAELLEALAPGAARNAVDCALWDLEAQFGVTQLSPPAAAAVGITRGPSVGAARASAAAAHGASAPAVGALGALTTAVTISLDTPDAMAAAARALIDVPLIKIKVDAQDPATRIRRIREICPNSALIVDPNESWTAEILRAASPTLDDCRVALLEQPLPAGREADLDGLEVPVPICADESCHTTADLPQLAGIFQFVNIKLDKTGGLTGALDLLQKARDSGFGIMVGCMICTSLSIAPAWRVATAAEFVDLDGPWWLKQDRPGGVSLQHGRLQPPGRGFWGESHDEHPES
ncbi:MAG: dipeptide epimerase [Proteobacteria bacterium]|nr:dipeptide epimerase [Pseudomonadota bacterium]